MILPYRPCRIQLSRKSGWNLQKVSMALNGLSAVMVARPSKYGNPHRVGFCYTCGAVHSHDEAVAEFEAMLTERPINLSAIAGKNLGCWCSLSQKCHADVLLQFANP